MSFDNATIMPSRLDPVPATLDELALTRLRELDPSGANQLLQRVVAAFLKSLDAQEQILAQGLEDGEAVDLNALRHVAHTLKSAAASLGATALSQRCAEIESASRSGQADALPPLLDAALYEIASARLAMQQLVHPVR